MTSVVRKRGRSHMTQFSRRLESASTSAHADVEANSFLEAKCWETVRDCLRADCYFYSPDWTRRLFVTEKTPGTLFARMETKFLSPWLSTTPSSVTCPPLTMMWIGGTGPKAYRCSAGSP